MPLLIIESPNKIRKLSSILGRDFKIMATKGHVIDLPPKKVGVNTRSKNFEPEYQVISGKGGTIKAIVEEAKKHDVIYLATDPDREGEAIAAHVADRLPKRGKTIRRVRFNAITKAAVERAIADHSEIDQHLFDAQQARRVTDRLVGYRISPIMWRKGISGASAGRVQSVALRYVVDREREIEAFVPEEYWEIDALMEPGFKARLYGVNNEKRTIRQEKTSRGLRQILMGSCKKLRVTKVEKKERRRKPAAPFTTSTLQQAANNILGWGVDKTMMTAQKIFEKGVITYHRTDSTAIDKEKLASMREHLLKTQGKDHVSDKTRSYKSKKASQEAHEAIRPTGEDPGALNDDEFRLFELIRNRFWASQMADAVYEQMKVEMVSIETKLPINFRVNGSKLLFDGFLKVYGAATADVILPEIEEGDEIAFTEIELAQKFTQPPSRYSDASLVKKMEGDGVGRPATYASIIGVLKKRKFIEKRGRTFWATELGKMVYDYMQLFFPNLVDPTFTAEMESRLDEVAEGRVSYVDVLGTWYEPFKADLKNAREGDAKSIFRTKHQCPQCQEGFLLRRPEQNGGWWHACERYPECKTVALTDEDGNLERDEANNILIKVPEPDPVVGEDETIPDCPLCGTPLELKNGKWGKWWGCPKYKETRCKGKANWVDPNAEPVVEEVFPGLPCDDCGGDMVKTTGRYGEYLKCKAPKCKGTHPVPLGLCPTCGNFAIKRYSRKKKRHFYCCRDWSEKCEFVTNALGDLKPLPGETVVVDI